MEKTKGSEGVFRLTRTVSTCFGVGYLPVAPGTWASLVAALVFKFALVRLTWPIYLAVLLVIGVLGIFAADGFSRRIGRRDPPQIVIDEVVGQWIAFIAVPPAWLNIAIGFFLFRVFDVLKPFGIRKIEALPGGLGIMADDVAAGLVSLTLLQGFLLVQ
jgi:phosphatidylglycerophosphatase A